MTGRFGTARLRTTRRDIRYCGKFFGPTGRSEPWQHAITVEALIGVLRRLQPGITELCCHPGFAGGLSSSSNAAERERERARCCDPQVAAIVEQGQIELCRFLDLQADADVA